MKLRESVAAIAERALNRVVRLDPEFIERLVPLQGRAIVVHVRDLEHRYHIEIEAGGFSITPIGFSSEIAFGSEDDERNVDLRISGPPLGLCRLLIELGREDGTVPDSVRLTGDLGLVQELRRAVSGLHIDWEEEVSRFTGDVAAHELGRVARATWRWGRGAARSMAANMSEFLQEEARLLPSRLEVEEFLNGVDAIRDDVERLAQRVERIAAEVAEVRERRD